MASWHHLNGQLFMPVKMLRDMPIHPREMTTADAPTQTRAGRQVSEDESFWNRKSDEAYDSGIYKSVQREGIVNPIRVGVEGREIGIRNGYHRVAAAHDIDPTMFVPITYGTPKEAQSERLPAHTHRENEQSKQ
jgi:hypothetical protein